MCWHLAVTPWNIPSPLTTPLLPLAVSLTGYSGFNWLNPGFFTTQVNIHQTETVWFIVFF